MRVATRDAAWHMVDDLTHIRDIIRKPRPTSGDLRRTSNLLRRLLIDNGGDFQKIAPPRLGRRLHFQAPNANAIEAYDRDVGREFFVLGAPGLFGLTAECFSISTSTKPLSIYPGQRQAVLYGKESPLHPPILLQMDSFLKQRVLFYKGSWISRRHAIKYVANIAGGTHSGNPDEPLEHILHAVRQLGSIHRVSDDGDARLKVNTHPFWPDMPKPIDVEKEGIDFVLLQIMATATCLVASPDVVELEEIVRTEQIT